MRLIRWCRPLSENGHRERLAFHFTSQLAFKASRYSIFSNLEGGFARPCLLPGWTPERCRRCGRCPPRPSLTDEVCLGELGRANCGVPPPPPVRAERDTSVKVCQAERPLHSLVGPSAGSGPRSGAPWGAGAPCHPANTCKGALWDPHLVDSWKVSAAFPLFPAPWFDPASRGFRHPDVTQKWLWQSRELPRGRTVSCSSLDPSSS